MTDIEFACLEIGIMAASAFIFWLIYRDKDE